MYGIHLEPDIQPELHLREQPAMKLSPKTAARTPKPAWLRRPLPKGPAYESVRKLIRDGQLHTVCQEAKCPNQFECFSQHTATFLIMGGICTRNCRFCNVQGGTPRPLDPQEPLRVAQAAQTLKLRYVVVTSVTRDDLADGGAAHFAATIAALRQRIEKVQVEVLVPDFRGELSALATVLEAGPHVLNHNLETVARLYPRVRPGADYQRSLDLLAAASRHSAEIPAKSGLMLGLGEQEAEICHTLADLRSHGVRLLTLGQYLQPSTDHLPVERYLPPEEFHRWRRIALEMGFSDVAADPFVRSSYRAKELYRRMDQNPLE
ncbi:MAG: lipoyl synthase [Desulfobacterales bacterium]